MRRNTLHTTELYGDGSAPVMLYAICFETINTKFPIPREICVSSGARPTVLCIGQPSASLCRLLDLRDVYPARSTVYRILSL